YYYRREGEERSTNFYGDARAELDAGPFTFLAGGGGGQFTQRYSIELDDRLQYQERGAWAGVTWRTSRRFSATAQVRDWRVTFAPALLRNGQGVKAGADRDSVRLTGELRYALTRRTKLLVSADAQDDTFFSQPTTVPRVLRSYRYMGGFEFNER